MNDDSTQKAVFMDEKTQKELNTPLADPNKESAAIKEFLSMVIQLIDAGKIDLYKPQSLINFDHYQKLTVEKQGKVDIEALNLLSSLRELYGLYKNGFEGTFQMSNLVERIKNTKDRLEEDGGDIFII